MSGSYFLYDSILEKCGNFWKNGRFSGRIWPDWGNTARADMAGLGKYCTGGYGRIGVYRVKHNITVSVEGSLSIN